MFAEDFGTYYYEQHKDSADPPILLIPNFMFYNIGAIEPNLFTATSNTVIDNEPYAMTIDFDRLMLNKLLTCIPESYADELRDFIDNNDKYPFFIRLEQRPIHVEIRARLGDLQHGDGEDFISMIVIDVSLPENQIPDKDLPF